MRARAASRRQRTKYLAAVLLVCANIGTWRRKWRAVRRSELCALALEKGRRFFRLGHVVGGYTPLSYGFSPNQEGTVYQWGKTNVQIDFKQTNKPTNTQRKKDNRSIERTKKKTKKKRLPRWLLRRCLVATWPRGRCVAAPRCLAAS